MPKGSPDFSFGISEFSVHQHYREMADCVREIVNLKLLIYAHSWAPAVGGVEATTRTLAEGLAKWSDSGAWPSIKVTVVTLTAAAGMNDSLVPFNVVRRPSIWRLVQLIRSTDILHLAGPALLPLALGRLLKKRTVLEHHNYQAMCPNGLLIHKTDLTICPGHFLAGRFKECVRCNSATLGRPRSMLKLLLAFPRRWLAKSATANVAPTCHVKARVALPRTQVIYHGVADADPSRGLLTKPAEGPVCFAFIGRLVKEKGVSDLLRSAHELASEGYEFRLKIVGDGPERAALEILVKDLDLTKHTEFTGAVSAASVSRVLTEATAVVIPSTWEEAAGLVALEQMMQGRLVIAADVGGLGETVNGFGLKFPPGDITALKVCMQKAVENPRMSIQMRMKARINAVREFSEERMVKEHLQLYCSIMRIQTRSRKENAGI